MNIIRAILLISIVTIHCYESFSQEADLESLALQYYQEQEHEKALDYFDKSVKAKGVTPRIYQAYLKTLEKTGNSKTAEKLLKKLIKASPMNPIYVIDYSQLLKKNGSLKQSEKVLGEYLNKIKTKDLMVRRMANYFLEKRMYEEAEKVYSVAAKSSMADYDLPFAELYYLWGKTDEMLTVYLEMLKKNPTNLSLVQDALQTKLSSNEDFALMEKRVLEYVQRFPNKIAFNEMLIWYYLQRKAFYKAFIYAKAVDKRQKLGGLKMLDIGQLSISNQKYRDAERIFSYLVENYKGKPSYPYAKRNLIKVREEMIKNTYPVDTAKIKNLVSDYEQMIVEMGINLNTIEAMRSMASLYAFYLDNKDTAIVILERTLKFRNLPRTKLAAIKIDLGDIYLLKSEPWEASLLYSQVEKAQKDEPLGHIAKLKNAQLNYYMGDFKLAKAHLDILKLATSREIANDAMELSILIQDNTGLDSSYQAMQDFANIDLLKFQHKYEDALVAYDSMLIQYPGHSLTDEIYWNKANINIKLGKYDEAIVYLEEILKDYSTDIWADDAHFLIGKIYEEKLNNKEKAMEYYANQLKNYPGSVFNVEARKRFRSLRGDKIN